MTAAATTWQSDLTSWLLGPGLQTFIIIVLAVILRLVLVRVIRHGVARATARAQRPEIAPVDGPHLVSAASQVAGERTRQRAAAVGTLLTSSVTIMIAGTAVLTILPVLGIAIAPLLASAGVIGVILGFGAQTLVKDYLAGIFIILEDQYGVGDLVDVGAVTARVEFVTLRYTRLRDSAGVIWYVRNGEIPRVANRSQGWAPVDVLIDVAANTTPRSLEHAMAEVTREMSTTGASLGLRTAPVLLGTEATADGWISVRIHAAVSPARQAEAVRAIEDNARRALTHQGITMRPTP